MKILKAGLLPEWLCWLEWSFVVELRLFVSTALRQRAFRTAWTSLSSEMVARELLVHPDSFMCGGASLQLEGWFFILVGEQEEGIPDVATEFGHPLCFRQGLAGFLPHA